MTREIRRIAVDVVVHLGQGRFGRGLGWVEEVRREPPAFGAQALGHAAQGLGAQLGDPGIGVVEETLLAQPVGGQIGDPGIDLAVLAAILDEAQDFGLGPVAAARWYRDAGQARALGEVRNARADHVAAVHGLVDGVAIVQRLERQLGHHDRRALAALQPCDVLRDGDAVAQAFPGEVALDGLVPRLGRPVGVLAFDVALLVGLGRALGDLQGDLDITLGLVDRGGHLLDRASVARVQQQQSFGDFEIVQIGPLQVLDEACFEERRVVAPLDDQSLGMIGRPVAARDQSSPGPPAALAVD